MIGAPPYAGVQVEPYVCAKCGFCRSACPIFEMLGFESNSPSGKIYLARTFLNGEGGDIPAQYAEKIFQCTLCGNCRQSCSAGIDLRRFWLEMRQRIAQSPRALSSLKGLGEAISSQHNILGEPNENRLVWNENLPEELAGFEPKRQAEVVYFVGCVSSFFPLVYGIPQAFVQILERAEVDYTVLGGEEWCCGFPLGGAGVPEGLPALARHNVTTVREIGARKLVTTCPSCYLTWKHDYAQLATGIDFEIMHSAEFLLDLLDRKQLKLKAIEEVVTFHDPCDLGRNAGMYEVPRRLIDRIPGIERVEMLHAGEEAFCCGGGGDLEMTNPGLSAGIARRRLQEVVETKATSLLSACQQCKRTLLGASRKEKLKLKVLDVTELVWRALEI